MKLESVGDVIATRELDVISDRGEAQKVQVMMGRPRQLPDHTDYYCPYEIKGGGFRKVMYACGVDAFQALQLAMGTIGVELDVLNKQFGGKLRWECDAAGGLGFPSL
ncbi:MAG TPA: hypothetical protein VEJ46_10630 [Candidatus Acidoferrum sp.]|nr:hypothetical protein [Candidatus Acidoferrum sp.]